MKKTIPHFARVFVWALLLAGVFSAGASAADPNKFLREGLKFYERGQYDKAIKQFVRVLELDPSQPTAKEYMMLCSQKIVEKKLGREAAQTVEQELALEKQLQSLSPPQPPVPAEDPYKFMDETPLPVERRGAEGVANAVADNQTAADVLKQRESLSEDLRRRSVGRENIVQLNESRGELVVTLFMNRLFLPYTYVLRDESFVALDHVVSQVRGDRKKKVVLRAVDDLSPAVQGALPDLSTQRCSALFSYLIHAIHRP